MRGGFLDVLGSGEFGLSEHHRFARLLARPLLHLLARLARPLVDHVLLRFIEVPHAHRPVQPHVHLRLVLFLRRALVRHQRGQHLLGVH